jgi:hypothetical protein
MTTEILLSPRTAYFVDGVELWDARRVAIEYGVSKATVRAMITKPGFPEPYALAIGGKGYFRATEIQTWAETTPYLLKTIQNRAKGIGRPSTYPRELVPAIKR